MPRIRAWALPTETSQDQNAGNPGLGATHGGLPGPECRESGPGRYPRRPPRTKMPGIQAWALPTEASQDQNAENPGLGATHGGLPGPKYRESGPGRYPRRPVRTRMPRIRAWALPTEASQDQNAENQGLANIGCLRNNSEFTKYGHADPAPRAVQGI
jgi:hypothetical protein